ncbi:MAG: hypothetical protein IPQ16_00990 [Geobacteraceae bacterium]|nr:hypothetical protein [Geobacteraceae bacterium]
MKCPKCGYNSFEIYDTCKKCANDLVSYKNIHGLKSIVLPLETRISMAEKLMAEKGLDEQAAVVDAPVDMFSFDTPENESTQQTDSFIKDDPFNFVDEPASPSSGGDEFSFNKDQISAQAKAEEEAFADLIESTSQIKSEGPSAQEAQESSDFSWDDTPTIATGEVNPPPEDDFNSLFGDTGDTAKK